MPDSSPLNVDFHPFLKKEGEKICLIGSLQPEQENLHGGVERIAHVGTKKPGI
jgi:hypothetical protein